MILSLAIALAREDAEVRLHSPQTKTEHFWLCVCAKCHLEKKVHYCQETHMERWMST